MRNRYGSRAVTPTTNQPGFWQTIGDQIPGLARGAYSGLLGLPGDVEEMAISGAPYALLSQGKLSPQRFSNLASQDYSPGLLTSEEIADPLRKEGLLSKRPLEGEYTELAGMFLSPDMFVGDVAKLGALGVGASIFTSPAQKAVREVAKDALPSQQWLKQLEGRGVKKDELEWTGLLNFLKGKKGNIQKSEVEDFIEANKIDVQEVVKGGGIPSEEIGELAREQTADELYALMTNDEILYRNRNTIEPLLQKYREQDITEPELEQLNEWYAGWGDNYPLEYFVSRTGEIERSGGLYGPDTTKFSKYQLPGGENYRELVLTVDADKNPYTKKDIIPISSEEYIERGDRMYVKQRIQDAEHNYWFDTPDGLKRTPKKDPLATDYLVDDDADIVASGAFKSPEEALEQVIREMNEVKKSQPKYTQGHYDEPNALSHIRFNERVDPDGNKVLFIEEIQSDWAQKGRKVGFSKDSPELQKELEILQGEIPKMDDELGKITDRQVLALEAGEKGKAAEIMKEYDELGLVFDKKIAREEEVKTLLREGGTGVPTAPFLEDTNQWAGLSMKRMIKWASDEGFDSIAWTTGKQQAARYDLSKQIDSITYDPASKKLYAYKKDNYEPVIRGKFVEPENLDDYIGKEAAKKLLDTKLKKMPERKLHPSRIANPAFTGDMFPTHILEGQELEIGGEGMAGFYDKILVDQAKKIGKKHGAKVEKGTVFTESGPTKTTTEEMREYIESGQDVEDLKKSLLDTREGREVWKMKLPSKLKEAAKEGLPYYALVPPGLLAVGAQRERQSLLE